VSVFAKDIAEGTGVDNGAGTDDEASADDGAGVGDGACADNGVAGGGVGAGGGACASANVSVNVSADADFGFAKGIAEDAGVNDRAGVSFNASAGAAAVEEPTFDCANSNLNFLNSSCHCSCHINCNFSCNLIFSNSSCHCLSSASREARSFSLISPMRDSSGEEADILFCGSADCLNGTREHQDGNHGECRNYIQCNGQFLDIHEELRRFCATPICARSRFYIYA